MRKFLYLCIATFCLVQMAFWPGLVASGRGAGDSRDAHTALPPTKSYYMPLVAYDNFETTRLVSIGPDWQLPNKDSYHSAISQNGRYVAFTSEATNLVPGDTNGKTDIFVVDRSLGSISRASVTSTGAQVSGTCGHPSISGDGRYVAFLSTATTLVGGDTNGKQDVFLHDMQTGQTTLVSVATNGAQANANSYNPQISSDGRFVVYESSASTLVANDLNASTDVFLYDRQLSQTERISVAANGGDGNDSSTYPALSADGRYVAFQSSASNLVLNYSYGIFVRDRQLGQTSIVSATAAGVQGNGGSGLASITADGRYVAFWSDSSNLVSDDTNLAGDVFVKDRQTGSLVRASISSGGVQANSSSYGRIAAGGGHVVFTSDASNLVAGDLNGREDVFLRDLQAGITTRLSVPSAGSEANGDSYDPAISADGVVAVFQSTANNLVVGDTSIPDGIFVQGLDIFAHDRGLNQTQVVSRLYAPAESVANSLTPVVSDNGRYVAFVSKSTTLVPGDTVGNYQKVIVRDMQLKQSVIASVSTGGVTGWGDSSVPSLSGDGQILAFASYANNLVTDDTNSASDVFVRNFATRQTVRVSVSTGGAQGNGESLQPRLSRDGGAVCFSSYASNLVAGDTNNLGDVFVRVLATGTTERISLATDGSQANNSSWSCAMSLNGRYVAFQSSATNLVVGDTNNLQDIFVRDRQTGQTSRVSVGSGGAQSNAASYLPSISDEGRYVAFQSAASNLVANDTNGCGDIFVYDRNTGGMMRASLASDGTQANGDSFNAVISGNGQQIVFESIARNLIGNDTNNNNDIYTRNLISGRTVRASVATKGEQGNTASNAPGISADGKYVVFQSAASNLVPGDTNNWTDIFVRDRGRVY